MKRTMTLAFATLCAAAAMTRGARAELFTACSVKPTPDGFVALRAAPSPGARILTRMRPDEVIVIETKGGRLVEARGWYRISHFHGQAMPNPGDRDYDKVHRGWVNKRLVDDCG